jgi:hypothetical protein
MPQPHTPQNNPAPPSSRSTKANRQAAQRATSPDSAEVNLPFIGWREWIVLPRLGIPRIKAKVDTGARSSAIHAFNIKSFQRGGQAFVRFQIHPVQHSRAKLVTVETELIDERSVRSSIGKAQLRPVIRTPIVLGHRRWPIEITLTDRDAMGFRMLLGRQAIRKHFLIDPGRSYLQGTPATGASASRSAPS